MAVTIIAIIFCGALAIFTFLWALNSMMTHYCPLCADKGRWENVLPVLPLFREWCPTCSTVSAHSDVIIRDRDDDSDAPTLN